MTVNQEKPLSGTESAFHKSSTFGLAFACPHSQSCGSKFNKLMVADGHRQRSPPFSKFLALEAAKREGGRREEEEGGEKKRGREEEKEEDGTVNATD